MAIFASITGPHLSRSTREKPCHLEISRLLASEIVISIVLRLVAPSDVGHAETPAELPPNRDGMNKDGTEKHARRQTASEYLRQSRLLCDLGIVRVPYAGLIGASL